MSQTLHRRRGNPAPQHPDARACRELRPAPSRGHGGQAVPPALCRPGDEVGQEMAHRAGRAGSELQLARKQEAGQEAPTQWEAGGRPGWGFPRAEVGRNLASWLDQLPTLRHHSTPPPPRLTRGPRGTSGRVGSSWFPADSHRTPSMAAQLPAVRKPWRMFGSGRFAWTPDGEGGKQGWGCSRPDPSSRFTLPQGPAPW